MHMVNDVTICSPIDVAHILEVVSVALSQPPMFIEHMHEERELCDLIDWLAEYYAISAGQVVDILEFAQVY